MNKGLVIFSMLVFSGMSHASSNKSEFDTIPPCKDNEIIAQVYTGLQSDLPDFDYREHEDIKKSKLREKISGYMNEFNGDNEKLKFNVTRLSSQIMTEKEKMVFFEGEQPSEFNGYMKGKVYKEIYKIKNSNGATAIYETFNLPTAEDGFKCNSIGSVYVVSFEG